MLNKAWIRLLASASLSVVLTAPLAGIVWGEPTTAVETRKNKKGKIDRWIYREGGVINKREYDRNGDGKPDLRIFEDHGHFLRKERDDNFDGKIEKVEEPSIRGSRRNVKTKPQ